MKRLLIGFGLTAVQGLDLLVPREVYITHDVHPSCDDCCAEGQSTDGTNFVFFGESYDSFYPCANGLVSFSGEVGTFTPIAFPIAQQPVIAAYWADVDLRSCRLDVNDHCSYFKLYTSNATNNEANLIDDLVQNLFGVTGFAATATIVQTWHNVAYYKLKTDKTNTFQAIITTDGSQSFTCFYYSKLEWTTGDASQGANGLGGIPAQMGFDAGDLSNKFSDSRSQTDAILELADVGRYCYEISATIVCDAGEKYTTYTDGREAECVPQQCAYLPEVVGTDNIVAGQCTANGVSNDDSCNLACEYSGSVRTQPASFPDGGTIMAALCTSATYSTSAECAEVGYDVVFSSGSTKVVTYESSDRDPDTFRVRLKSAPAADSLVVDVTVSDATEGELNCGSMEASEFAPTCQLIFTPTQYNTYQTVTVRGRDDSDSDDNQNYVISLDARAGDESCTIGCSGTTQPYADLPVHQVDAENIDNEGLQLVAGGVTTTNEEGKGTTFTLQMSLAPRGDTTITCATNDATEARITDSRSESQVSTTPGVVQFTNSLWEEIKTFTVIGEPDEIEDGDVSFNIECAIVADCSLPASANVTCYESSSINPLTLVNGDVNVPGVIIAADTVDGFSTENCGLDAEEDNYQPPLPGGCGRIQTSEQDSTNQVAQEVTVRLATQPSSGVVVIKGISTRPSEVSISGPLTFTTTNWNVDQTFRVAGVVDGISDLLQLATIRFEVDVDATTDTGYNGDSVYGYKSCQVGRRQCFAYDAPDGVSPGNRFNLTMSVANTDIDFRLSQEETSGLVAGIVAVVIIAIIIIVVVIIVALLAIAKTKRDREEEALRRQQLGKGADQLEKEIDFRMDDDMDSALQQLLAVNNKLRAECERLKAENVTLSDAAGEPPMVLASTDSPETLVDHIKQYKAENDRLRDSGANKKPGDRRRNAGKKKTAFGQEGTA